MAIVKQQLQSRETRIVQNFQNIEYRHGKTYTKGGGQRKPKQTIHSRERLKKCYSCMCIGFEIKVESLGCSNRVGQQVV